MRDFVFLCCKSFSEKVVRRRFGKSISYIRKTHQVYDVNCNYEQS